MRTYKKAWCTGDPDPWDSVFGDIRRGDIELGSLVRVWNQVDDMDECGYVIGRAGTWHGAPCVNEEEDGK